jgi:hypothetical protein
MQTAHSLWQTFSSPTGGAATTATTSTTTAAASTAGASLAALPPASGTPSLWVGAALVTGAVGAAYARRDDLVGGAGWLGNHAKCVSHLWDQAELARDPPRPRPGIRTRV